MHPENMAIVKALVSVAWADGDYGEKERQMLDALLEAYKATQQLAARKTSTAGLAPPST